MRGRMYGSTDIHKLRTCTSPSWGGGTSTVASSKCSGPSTPLGRLFKRISRDETMTARLRANGAASLLRCCGCRPAPQNVADFFDTYGLAEIVVHAGRET